MSRKKELTGKFNRLTIVHRDYAAEKEVAARTGRTPQAMYWVRCDCGTEKMVQGNAIVKGATKSCGCLNRETVSERLSAIRSQMFGNPRRALTKRDAAERRKPGKHPMIEPRKDNFRSTITKAEADLEELRQLIDSM